MIIAGIDEAGYGPMLGPLVISIAVFRVETPAADETLVRPIGDLWPALDPLVTRKPNDGCIPVNDSKLLYSSGRKSRRSSSGEQRRSASGVLRHLEEGLLPFILARHERLPESLRELLHRVSRRGRGAADDYLEDYPWYAKADVPIPLDTYTPMVCRLAGKLVSKLEEARIEFLGTSAIPVEVVEFNRGLATWENKARVSFRTIAWFLRRLWKQFPREPVDVVVDRQGGRTRYARTLFESMRPQGLCIDEQGEETSSYRLRRRRRRDGSEPETFRITFTKNSERKSLPVALASMASKYLRELHMELFNRYWTEKSRKLAPTAGYVVDARRFLEDTAALRATLGTDSKLLIRDK